MFFPHIIHNLNILVTKRDFHYSLPYIQKRDFSIALTEKEKRDLMYPWLPWLYCYLSWAVDVIKVLGEK